MHVTYFTAGDRNSSEIVPPSCAWREAGLEKDHPMQFNEHSIADDGPSIC